MGQLLTFDALDSQLCGLRAQRKSIGLCHGVFDLLHIGHIKHFQEARDHCDVLVVSVTPDIYVNKGPGRPVFSEAYRAEAIAALAAVDFVVINKWATAQETIQRFAPDLYIKGPDYVEVDSDITGNLIAEKASIQSVGGAFLTTTSVTFSSSNIINKQISSYSGKQKSYIDKIRNHHSFNDILLQINNLRHSSVLFIGESIIDEYVFCNTIGKSGKEPVLVSKRMGYERYPGGILAIANIVSSLVDKVGVLTCVGDRDDQMDFIRSATSLGSNLQFIRREDSPTITKRRYVDAYTMNKIQGIYDLNDEPLSIKEETQALKLLDQTIDKYDVVIVADYGHGFISSRMVDLIQGRARYLAVNAQLNSFNTVYHSISKYSKANFVCIHEGELRHDYRSRSEKIEVLSDQLRTRLGADAVVVTRGNLGSLASTKDATFECPAFFSDVVDRIGAGDSLLGVTSLCLGSEMPPDMAILLGTLAAGETVGTVGVGNVVERDKLIRTIEIMLK